MATEETPDIYEQQTHIVWRFADVEFDAAQWQLCVDDQPVALERRPLEVLACLLRHAGEVVTKEELLEAAWPGAIVVDNALTNAIGKLRRALGDRGGERIVTQHRVGYRLTGQVERETRHRRAGTLQLEAGQALPGRRNWVLEARLWESNNAEVWLGIHRKTAEQRVFKFAADSGLTALKREATISRLLHEALGERPDLVRVTDWNFDASPYYLEYPYAGSGLPAWAETEGGLASIPLKRRLALVTSVAQTVADAHAIGVLHKDLKPANILIDTQCDPPTARVVDFGSGQITQPEQLEAYGITGMGLTTLGSQSTGEWTGTPLYLAPEVIAGQAPTIQSDVYALGVMLYQMVLGDFAQPLAAGWEWQIKDELLREDIAAAADGNPARRLASAQELVTRLNTLEHRRAERLHQRRQEARMQAAEARVRRIRARRPWLVATGLALVAGIAVSLWQYRQANEAYRNAQAMNDFLQHDLMSSANPVENEGRADVTMIQALRHAAGRIDKRFPEQPRIAYELHARIARAMSFLNLYPEADAQYQRGIELGLAAGLEADDDFLFDRLRYARMLSAHGDTSRAATQLEQVEIHMGRGTGSKLRAQVQYQRGQTFMRQGKDERAIASFRKALNLRPDAHGYKRPLVQLLADRGEWDEARKLADEIIAFEAGTYGRKHGGAVSARIQMAWIFAPTQSAEARLTQFNELVEDTRTAFGANSESHYGALLGWGQALVDLGRWQAAIYPLEQAYNGLDSIASPTSFYKQEVAAPLGRAYQALGRCEQALPRLAEATGYFTESYGATQEYSANAAVQWAACLLDSGQASAAGEVMTRFKNADSAGLQVPPALAARIQSLLRRLQSSPDSVNQAAGAEPVHL